MAKVVKLSKAITVGDKSIDELSLDIETLTGGDIEMCVREAGASKGEPVLVYEYDLEFHAQVAMKLTGISRDALRKLPAKDYQHVMAPIRGFFIGSD